MHDRVTGDDGRPWIVMELVRGRSLDDLLKAEGRLPPAAVAQIGLRLLDALRAAHQAGITHRDIKPANVLLENDRVVLTDFGIAAVDGDATLTGTGAVLGTPAYMSPEQVRGQEVAAAADLWSLGATLYTAVEGRPPFEGAGTGAIFIAIATQDPAPPAHAGPLEPVLRALLHRDPSQRPVPDSLHAQLTRVAQGGAPAQPTLLLPPAQPPVPPLPRRSARSRKKKVVLLALVAATTALMLAITVTWAVTAIRERQGDMRYEANLRALAGLGTSPGHSTEFRRTYDNTTVEVDSTLCKYESVDDGCNLEGQVTTVVNWFRSRPGVRSVILEPPTEEPNTFPNRSLLVLTQSSLRITEVVIYDQTYDHVIMLSFTVG
ncbi:serine/threonine-protein kinase [Spirillospora sp. NPDC048823]|uniref:serine/threonine-protein kinase n=1 Tax=unclassified Spirillospora TaxID=2642701 RepID=UPI003720245A